MGGRVKVEIKDLTKIYNDKTIFNKFSIELLSDKVNCIVGESGCGKSTFLNIIAGLTSKNEGIIKEVNNKDISYIFQEDRLIEWLTIYDNLKMSLRKYAKKDELEERINYILEIIDLKHVKNKYPSQLSGGMRQRINIARAIGKPSKIILMDEPFKSLDYKIKYSIIDELKDIIFNEERIVIMVTHDVDEAIYFNGRIIVFGDNPVRIKGIFDDNLKFHKDEILRLI